MKSDMNTIKANLKKLLLKPSLGGTRSPFEMMVSENRSTMPLRDKGDAAKATDDISRRAALVNNNLATVASIERAISKIDEGSYGLCDYCGSLIEPDRLEALPYATSCIACKSSRRPQNSVS